MRWFEGSIPDAIQETKATRKLLLVYVLDSTEDSQSMTAVLDEDVVATALPPEKVVALKLESGTDSFAQFSVFYPVLILPSVYFIGDNGTPLEVVGGHQNVEAFLERSRNAFKLHEQTDGADASSSVAGAPPSTTDVAASTSMVAPLTVDVSAGEASLDPTPEGGAVASLTTASSQPLEDRVLTAKEKIEAQNRERINKENEETKKRELERRRLGQV